MKYRFCNDIELQEIRSKRHAIDFSPDNRPPEEKSSETEELKMEELPTTNTQSLGKYLLMWDKFIIALPNVQNETRCFL